LKRIKFLEGFNRVRFWWLLPIPSQVFLYTIVSYFFQSVHSTQSYVLMCPTRRQAQISLDVKYFDDYAAVGYALFESHKSREAIATGQVIHQGVMPYESGLFYKRELPCLLAALEQLDFEPQIIYIDAYVWLGENKKGLGAYLYEALSGQVPVIGISKTVYVGATDSMQEVIRQESVRPLYVSAIGMDVGLAADWVWEMPGPYRLPDMIKLADRMSRQTIVD
jgi:deoxyribonuclease V